MATNKVSNLGLIAFLSMMMEGRLSVVTAIMKERTVPSRAPLASRASAMGMVPKMSAYIGIPTRVARMTPRGLVPPKMPSIQDSGIQL